MAGALAHEVNTPGFTLAQDVVQLNTTVDFCAFGAACSLGHAVQYSFDWGDDTELFWVGYLPGEPTCDNHKWNTKGDYQVRVRARCVQDNDIVSPWSEPHSVTVLCKQCGDEPPQDVPAAGSGETYGDGGGCFIGVAWFQDSDAF